MDKLECSALLTLLSKADIWPAIKLFFLFHYELERCDGLNLGKCVLQSCELARTL